MTQPLFPSMISAQLPSVESLTIKTMVRKIHQNNGHTGSSCLDKACLDRGGGSYHIISQKEAYMGAIPGNTPAPMSQQVHRRQRPSHSTMLLAANSKETYYRGRHLYGCHYPPSPLHSNRLRTMVSSHPRGNIPQLMLPSPADYYAKDPRHKTGHADTRAYEAQNEPETA